MRPRVSFSSMKRKGRRQAGSVRGGRSRPVRLLEILVYRHDRGHGLAAARHDALVLARIRDDVAARVDPADRGGHVSLHFDEPLPFEFDAPFREGADLRPEPDVHDHVIDVEDLLLERTVVVHDRALDVGIPLNARDLRVVEDFDRALQDGLDALLHRANSPRRWTRMTCFATAKISRAISRALSP